MNNKEPIISFLKKNHDVKEMFRRKKEDGMTPIDAIFGIQNEIADLYFVFSKLIKRRLKSKYLDVLHDKISEWDSLYSFYNLDIGHVSFSKDNNYNHMTDKDFEINRYIKGEVIKSAMQKTVTMTVTRLVKHHPTGKILRKSKKYLVHDENSECYPGDKIIAKESKPLSKRKRHMFYRPV